MKIDERNADIYKKFKDVEAGVCFEYEAAYYIKAANTIKICEDSGKYKKYNATGLVSGSFVEFEDDDKVVVKYNAKVIFE